MKTNRSVRIQATLARKEIFAKYAAMHGAVGEFNDAELLAIEEFGLAIWQSRNVEHAIADRLEWQNEQV